MQMFELNTEGDTKYQWDMTDPDEVQQAKKVFETYRNRGFCSFSPETTAAITEFDPSLETIVFVPMVAGG